MSHQLYLQMVFKSLFCRDECLFQCESKSKGNSVNTVGFTFKISLAAFHLLICCLVYSLYLSQNNKLRESTVFWNMPSFVLSKGGIDSEENTKLLESFAV